MPRPESHELPLGKGRRTADDFLIVGWQIGGIAALKPGPPAGVSMTRDTATVGEGGKLRTRIRDANNGPKALDERLDTGAIEFRGEFPFGNVGVTPVTGAGIGVLDSWGFKNNSIAEGVNFQIRAEFFNLTNTAIWGERNTTLGTPASGEIRSPRVGSREIQVELRSVFCTLHFVRASKESDTSLASAEMARRYSNWGVRHHFEIPAFPAEGTADVVFGIACSRP